MAKHRDDILSKAEQLFMEMNNIPEGTFKTQFDDIDLADLIRNNKKSNSFLQNTEKGALDIDQVTEFDFDLDTAFDSKLHPNPMTESEEYLDPADLFNEDLDLDSIKDDPIVLDESDDVLDEVITQLNEFIESFDVESELLDESDETLDQEALLASEADDALDVDASLDTFEESVDFGNEVLDDVNSFFEATLEPQVTPWDILSESDVEDPLLDEFSEADDDDLDVDSEGEEEEGGEEESKEDDDDNTNLEDDDDEKGLGIADDTASTEGEEGSEELGDDENKESEECETSGDEEEDDETVGLTFEDDESDEDSDDFNESLFDDIF